MFNYLKRRQNGTAHFLHIGKTGGSAVKLGLRKYRKKASYKLELHGHETTLADVPAGESVIFFLRDPVSRFKSGFYSRQRKGQPRYYHEWSADEAEVFKVFSTPNELAQALADTASPDHAMAIKGMNTVLHLSHFNTWYGDLDYFRSRIDDILFVGFQESLDDDFLRLKELLCIPASAELPRDDVSAHRNPSNLDYTINENYLPALKQWYKEDYEFIALCKNLMQERSKAG